MFFFFFSWKLELRHFYCNHVIIIIIIMIIIIIIIIIIIWVTFVWQF